MFQLLSSIEEVVNVAKSKLELNIYIFLFVILVNFKIEILSNIEFKES